jgi:fatty-acyl-CoA synthase
MGAPTTSQTLSGQTLRGLFTAALDRFGSRPAVVAGGVAWTYRDIVDHANRLAHYLHRMGVGAGDPVALAISNRAEWIIADQAIIRAGAAKVPVNDMLSAPEIEYILNDSGARVALVDGSLMARVAAADAADLSTLISVDGAQADDPRIVGWADALAPAPEGAGPPEVSVDPADVTMILYTGGTTGRQKGVVHTQRTLASCETAHVIELGLQDDERMLIVSPLPHATGFLAQAGMLKGATLYIEPAFDPEVVLERITRDRITFVFMVPTMIYRVLDRAQGHRANGQRLDLSALRTLLYGAAPIALDKLARGLELFGPVFMQLYGQSEAPDFITRLRREDHDLARPERLASCGQVTTFMEMAVVDDEDRPLPAGEAGQVVARGPYVMRGYHNLPEKTDETLAGGWLHTGDLGRLDEDGYLYLLDRMNDMIISGGMNVYSAEVEVVVQACAGVDQVAVVGLPDDDWGERVVALVVPATGRVPDIEQIRSTCREQLAAYKRPKEIRLVDELPVTPYGKVDKKSLRRQHANVTT